MEGVEEAMDCDSARDGATWKAQTDRRYDADQRDYDVVQDRLLEEERKTK